MAEDGLWQNMGSVWNRKMARNLHAINMVPRQGYVQRTPLRMHKYVITLTSSPHRTNTLSLLDQSYLILIKHFIPNLLNTQSVRLLLVRSGIGCRPSYCDRGIVSYSLEFEGATCSKRKRKRSDPVLWQNPLYQQKIRKPKDNTQTPPKTSITQRLRTDLGRSVGVTSHPTGVVKPVYGYPTFPLTATAV